MGENGRERERERERERVTELKTDRVSKDCTCRQRDRYIKSKRQRKTKGMTNRYI